MGASLYETDFYRWTQQQAAALRDATRAGANPPIDWANLAEEVESLGRSDRRGLRNRFRTILIHLLKLHASPATEPRAGWREAVRNTRVQLLKGVLQDSPSLRREVAAILDDELEDAKALAGTSLEEHGERDDAARRRCDAFACSAEQVLGDWFPEERSEISR